MRNFHVGLHIFNQMEIRTIEQYFLFCSVEVSRLISILRTVILLGLWHTLRSCEEWSIVRMTKGKVDTNYSVKYLIQ
jgi:hypothetical protein